jgi:hypothetical protein
MLGLCLRTRGLRAHLCLNEVNVASGARFGIVYVVALNDLAA